MDERTVFNNVIMAIREQYVDGLITDDEARVKVAYEVCQLSGAGVTLLTMSEEE